MLRIIRFRPVICAMVAVSVATLLTQAIASVLVPPQPLLFIAAVVLSGWFGGWTAIGLSAILSALSLHFYLSELFHTAAYASTAAAGNDGVQLGLFFLVAAISSLPVIQLEQIRRSMAQSRAAEQSRETDRLLQAQVEQALHPSSERERALNRVLQAIRRSLDLDTIFAVATAEVGQLIGTQHTTIVQYLPQESCWRHRAEYRYELSQPSTLEIVIPDANNPYAEQLKQLQIVQIDDTTAIDDPINQELAQLFPGSWLLVPLVINQMLWGSLTLVKPTHTWQAEEVNLARRVADQLAIAIQQAQQELAERQQAEAALSRGQTLLKEMEHLSQIGGWDMNLRTGESQWTEGVCRIHELPFDRDPYVISSADSVINNYVSFYAPEARSVIQQAFLKICNQGQPYDLELPFVTAKGNHRWVRTTAIPVCENEQVVRVVGTFMDITKRKQAEITLRQYERMVSTTPDGAALLDRNYVYQIVNQAYLDWNHKRHDEIVGHSVADLLGHDVFETVIKPHFDRALAGEIIRYAEWFDYAQTGRQFVGITYAPYVEPDGRISGVVVTSRDLTNLKRAEAELQEKEIFLRSIYEGTEEGIFVIDVLADGDFRYVGLNPAHSRLTGLSTVDLQGKTPEQVMPPADAASARSNYQSCVRAGQSITYTEYMPFQAENCWWFTRLTPLRDQNNRIYRIVGASTNITDWRQAEQELKESRAFLNQVINVIPDMIFVKDEQYRFVLMNQAAGELMGIPLERFLGRSDYDFFPQAQADHFRQKDQQVFQTGLEAVVEEPLTSLTGKTHWLLTKKSCFQNQHGQKFLLGVSRDITERKRAEDALRRYERIVSTTPDGVALIDRNYCYQVVNQTYLDRTHRTFDEIIGHSVAEVNGTEMFESVIKPQLDRTLTGEIISYAEWFDYAPLGRQFIQVTYVPYFDPDSTITGVVVTTRDLTNLKQAEAALQASEERLRFLLTSSPAVIYTASPDVHHEPTFVSENVVDVLGYTAQEFCQQALFWISRVHPDDLPVIAAARSPLFEFGQAHFEYRFQHQDGNYRWIHDELKLIRDEAGNPIELIGYCVDISDQKQAEIALQQLNEQLEQRVQERTAELAQANEILRQNEARFQRLASNTPGMIHQYVLHPDGSYEFTYASSACQQIYEIAPTEIVHDKEIIGKLVHPEDAVLLQTAVIDSATTLQPFNQEIRIITPNDRLKWIQVSSQPERQPNGDVIWDGVVIDITDRKAAETALQISEQNLRTVFNNVNSLLLLHDLDGTLLDVNDRVLEFYGLDREQLLKLSIVEDFSAPDALFHLLPDYWSRAVAGETVHFEWKGRKPRDGSFFDCEITLIQIVWNDKMVILANAQDVSDRNRAELEIRRNRDLSAAIFQEATDAIILADPVSRLITDCNQRTVDLFEVDSKTELIGLEGHMLRKTPWTAAELAEVKKKLQNQEILRQECEYYTRKGRLFWGGVTLKPIQVAEQQMVLVQITDIDDRKQAELRLRHQAEADQLLATIAQTINQSIQLDAVLSTCLEQIRQFLDCDRVVVCRFDPAYNVVIEREAVSQPEFSLVGRTIEDPCFGQDWAERYQQGYITVRGDTQTNELVPCYAEFLAQLQIRANLVVAILHANQIWGLLIAHQCSEARQWQPFEVDLFKQMALQIGIAGQKAILYGQLEDELDIRRRAELALAQQVQRERLLRTISDQIRQSLRLDEILATAVIEAQRVLQADRAVIFRLNSDRSGMVIQEASQGDYPAIAEMYLTHEHFSLESYEFYLQGQARVVSRTSQDDQAACLTEFMEQIGVKSKLVAPILHRLEDNTLILWGLLIAHACADYRQWQLTEADLLQQLATQVGIAIQQAHLYMQLESQLSQKEVLLKEVHHRVKNNLQVISSMLWLQAKATQHSIVFTALEDTRNRIQAMALIHETLYQSTDLGQINFHEYIRRLSSSILAAHSTRPNQIVLNYDLQPAVLSLETAIPCGLLLNELVTNAIKHAFPDQRSGEVCITLKQLPPAMPFSMSEPASSESPHSSAARLPFSPPCYALIIQDNGIGIPADLDLKKLKSLGLKIAYDLALQLRGNLELEQAGGTRFRLTFSVLEYRKRF